MFATSQPSLSCFIMWKKAGTLKTWFLIFLSQMSSYHSSAPFCVCKDLNLVQWLAGVLPDNLLNPSAQSWWNFPGPTIWNFVLYSSGSFKKFPTAVLLCSIAPVMTHCEKPYFCNSTILPHLSCQLFSLCHISTWCNADQNSRILELILTIKYTLACLPPITGSDVTWIKILLSTPE